MISSTIFKKIFKSKVLLLILIFLMIFVYLSSSYKPAKLIVISSAFKNGEKIPVKYTLVGLNYSIPLEIRKIPAKAKSLVIIMSDPDAPYGTFYHWIVYNIPVNHNIFKEHFPKKRFVGEIEQGFNDFGSIGYDGPYPPKGQKHRYFITVYAIDIKKLYISGVPKAEDVIKKIEGHIIGKGVLMGTFERK